MQHLDAVQEPPDAPNRQGRRGRRGAGIVQPLVVVRLGRGFNRLGGQGGAEGAAVGLGVLVHGVNWVVVLPGTVYIRPSIVEGSRKCSGGGCI